MQDIFFKSMSERSGSDMERLWIWISKSIKKFLIQIKSRSTPDPPFSDIDLKNKMTWVWIPLRLKSNLRVWIPLRLKSNFKSNLGQIWSTDIRGTLFKNPARWFERIIRKRSSWCSGRWRHDARCQYHVRKLWTSSSLDYSYVRICRQCKLRI